MIEKSECFQLKPDSPDDIDPWKISQGYPDDCTTISPLMFMASSTEGRKTLYDMVTVNPRTEGALHDSYTVVFPGDPMHGIIVNGLTESEKMLACSSGTNDIYLAVIEKALGQYCNDSSPIAKKVVMIEAVTLAMNSPSLGWLNGTSYHDPIELISGFKVEEIQTRENWNKAEAEKAALKAFSEHRMVSVGVKEAPPRSHSKAEILRKHPNHAYVMKSCDRAGIVLRNPVEDNPREFRLTWDELHTGTSCLLIANSEKREK